jgi:hypothetical protein
MRKILITLMFLSISSVGLFAQQSQVLDSDKILPLAEKNSYEIVFDDESNVVPFGITDEFLIWVEKNRDDNNDLTVRYNSDFQVYILSRKKLIVNPKSK